MNRWLRFAVFSFARIIASLVIIALITPGGGMNMGMMPMSNMSGSGGGMSMM